MGGGSSVVDINGSCVARFPQWQQRRRRRQEGTHRPPSCCPLGGRCRGPRGTRNWERDGIVNLLDEGRSVAGKVVSALVSRERWRRVVGSCVGDGDDDAAAAAAARAPSLGGRGGCQGEEGRAEGRSTPPPKGGRGNVDELLGAGRGVLVPPGGVRGRDHRHGEKLREGRGRGPIGDGNDGGGGGKGPFVKGPWSSPSKSSSKADELPVSPSDPGRRNLCAND